ncbi:hypothetical protein Q8F55_003945 [Vanrija albida]|uniref:Rieske domain-containing protein n=1 Tax=Vanrija albida TaxID=181172 RepID=A0ABR3Q5D2_9TREE
MTGKHIEVCSLQDTLSHTRYFLNLRTKSTPAIYRRLLLFRINKPSASPQVPQESSNGSSHHEQAESSSSPSPISDASLTEFYCMEETCPHLGAPLSHAELEIDDIENTRTIDLRGGTSATGLSTCTYNVRVEGTGSDATVWVETPSIEGDHAWEVVEFRGVSEEFADPPPLSLQSLELHDGQPTSAPSQTQAELPGELPKTLLEFAHLILATSDPILKCALTREAVTRMRAGKLRSIRPSLAEVKRVRGDVGLLDEPPREQVAVPPGRTGKRGKGGSEKSRILMLHALANIEQYAIDLAWDIIARFAEFEVEGERLPVDFFLDWAKVAEDEAKHYSLLSKRLVEMGSYFGAHTVHAGLWESASDTADSLLSRIAIIHLVAEARGVDMNPLTMAKLRAADDAESTRILEIIHADEITHVTTGHRWFSWICNKRGLDPVQQFRLEVSNNFHGDLKGPFNVEDRAKAGLTPDFYTDLRGHHQRREDRQAAYAHGGGKSGGDEHLHPRLT